MTKSENAASRSKNYVGTIKNDSAGMAEYEAVKAEARAFNELQRAMAKASGETPLVKRVDIFARLGKNNPNAALYRNKDASVRRIAPWASPYQRIKREHAATLDIYVTLGYAASAYDKIFGSTSYLFRSVA